MRDSSASPSSAAGRPGGSAALALARGGAEVDLYLPERPGEKPCGGAVPEHVLPRLAGFDPAPLPAVVSPAAVLENAAGGRVELCPRKASGMFRRRDLDARPGGGGRGGRGAATARQGRAAGAGDEGGDPGDRRGRDADL